MPAPYKDVARRRALGARADLPREDVPRLIEYSRDADPRVRTWAVNEMCPCDLRMDLPITLKEAVLGAKVNAPTLTGEVALTVPPHSNTGKVLRLKGKGLPGAAGEPSGDLYIKLVVEIGRAHV